ncbi:MAG: AtpZ/AtpI family protein [Desulfobacterales bacterium]
MNKKRMNKKRLFDYKKNQPWAENMQIVMQLGLTMAGCIGFCFFVGLQIDKWLGTRGIFVTIFIFLGVIGGAMVTYRQIMEIYEDKDISPGVPPYGPAAKPPVKASSDPADKSSSQSKDRTSGTN